MQNVKKMDENLNYFSNLNKTISFYKKKFIICFIITYWNSVTIRSPTVPHLILLFSKEAFLPGLIGGCFRLF